jgi:mono/diheme cytochrome c family protein
MSDEGHKKKPVSTEPVVAGLVAEFSDPHEVLHAAERVRDAGYRKWDVYSPFPLHGIDDIMRRPTILPWFSAIGAVLGLTTALLLQWWTNAVDYPIQVSGKLPFAFPASMPINFELTVLFTAFATFFSIILTSGLPKLYNPWLMNDRFRKGVTNDKVCIAIDASDPKFSRSKTADLLRSLHPVAVEEVMIVPESAALPAPLKIAAVVVLIVALVPPILIVRKRATLTTTPRIHLVQDMDFQPKFKPQSLNPFFADLLSFRPNIPGTVARGDLQLDQRFFDGIDPSAPVAAISNVAYQEGDKKPEEEKKPDAAPANPAPAAQPGAPAAAPVDNTPYSKEFPAEIIEQLKTNPGDVMKRGQQRFNIYCATCHGLEGTGDGLVSRRAAQLEQPTWVKPLSLHDQPVQEQPVGKLFRTITHGIRKMPGYGSQITPADRWAIVLYIKALQRAKNASASDVPASELDKLQ